MTEKKLQNIENLDHCSLNTPKLRSVTMGNPHSLAVKTNDQETYACTLIIRDTPNGMVKDAAFRAGWKDPILTRIGDYYPVSRTHRTFPKSDLPMILERLVSVFRILNFHTTFYDSPCVRAVCRSMQPVELCVNLWESRHQTDVVILDIQRIFGDTIQYAKQVRRILAYAFQKTPCATDDYTRSILTIASRDQYVGLSSLSMPASRIVTDDALNIASSMVLTDRRDARSLGLESLVILTDDTKTEISLAREVASVILLGRSDDRGGNDLKLQQLHKRLFHLAFCGQWPDSVQSSGESGYDDKSHVYLALMAIANAISLESPEIVNVALDMHDACSLMSGLENYIWNAHKDPHAAYLATRISSLICRVQPSFVRRGIALESAVRAAQQIGHCSHSALATETGQLLSAWEV